jgi:hypothetical protein
MAFQITTGIHALSMGLTVMLRRRSVNGAILGYAQHLRSCEGRVAKPTRLAEAPRTTVAGYRAALALGASRGGRRYNDKTLDSRAKAAKRFDGWFAGLASPLKRPLRDAVPPDLVAYMEGFWLLHCRAKTKLPSGEVVPAYSTVKNELGAIGRLFDNLGCTGLWSDQTQTGNPRNSKFVSDWLAGYDRDLFKWGYEACAAYPLSDEKRRALVDYLDGERASAQGAGRDEAALELQRDALLYCYLWDSVQRGSEGSRLRFEDMFSTAAGTFVSPNGVKNRQHRRCGAVQLEDCSGYSFLRRLPTWKEALAGAGLGFDGSHFVFPAVCSSAGGDRTAAVTGSQLYSRFVSQLKAAGLYEGESTHSFRRGRVQSLAAGGMSLADIADRMLVSTDRVAGGYADQGRLTRFRPAT